MFEQSLFASGVSLNERRSAWRTRRLALASVALQGLVVGAFIVVPLMFPATLPALSVAPKMTSLTMLKPEVKVRPKPMVVPTQTTNATAMRAPTAAPRMTESRGGGTISRGPAVSSDSGAPSLYVGGGASMTPSLGAGLGFGAGTGPAVVAVVPKSVGPLTISQGVSKGMLLAPILPVYPRIAVMSHTEGTVVVTATIDKRGRIVGLQVLSGPDMLKTAAVDAVKEARYRPYLLNGEPTDVTTTISVTFRIGA